jgi:hypothetical protein
MKVEQSSAKPISVGPYPARLGLFEREGEGIEQFARAKPDEAVCALLDVDAERRCARTAGPAIGTVGGNHQVPVALAGILLTLKLYQYAKRPRALGQYFEQALAPDADEAVTRRNDRLPVHPHVNIVPMGAFPGNDLTGERIVAN